MSASKSRGAMDSTCKCPSRSRESSVAWLLRLSPVLLLSEQVDVDGGAPVGRLQFPRALSPIETLQEVNVLRVCHLPWRPCNSKKTSAKACLLCNSIPHVACRLSCKLPAYVDLCSLHVLPSGGALQHDKILEPHNVVALRRLPPSAAICATSQRPCTCSCHAGW